MTTLSEAIKLQNELLSILPEVGFNKYIASTKLGIEALEACKARSDRFPNLPHLRLPGETKE